MNVEEIRTYSLSKPGVEEGFPFGEETLVFKVNGKIFLLVGLTNQPLQFNVKCDPEHAIELREQHDCILPGYHMNKKHWNTVMIDNTLSKKELKALIDHSYDLVFKARRKAGIITSVLAILLAISGHAFAQELIPFQFTSEDENRLIKENDSLKYYAASGDTENTVAINEDEAYYKLLNKERKVIAEGAYIAEGDKYLQDGKWVEKYDNGKVKKAGYYQKGKPIGTWQEYYSTGKIKTISNYGLFVYRGEPGSCLSGSYQEFYADGRLKINGFYSAVATSYKDTMVVEDPVTGQKVYKAVSHSELKAEKAARWEYYSESGELDKKEEH